MIVGLTGGIGCGKSAVAHLFSKHGIDVIDTDAISRNLTAVKGEAMPAIHQAFGSEAVAADQSLNRDAMRRIVFSDPAAKKKLEAILHPLIRSEVTRQLARATSPYVVLDVPLLFETDGYPDLIDTTLAVDCPEAEQVRRVTARSGLTEAQARAIMASQVPRAVRCARADTLIDNSGSLADLEKKIVHLHAQYLSRASERKS